MLSPGPSARTLAASCDGSTLILKGLMGICCLNIKGDMFVDRKQEMRAEGCTCEGSHLICKQNHDGVLTRAGGRVLYCKRIVVILDDVKVNVSLSWSHHTRSTFYPDANITCCRSKSVSMSTQRWRKSRVWTGSHPVRPRCSPL